VIQEVMQTILSICIPTYNRANWLRSSLWNWLPQVKKTNGLVELIVCDNDSSDHTKQVIEEAQTWGNFQYHYNSENIGPIRNIYRLVKELAKGEFVWIVGDDDLPNVDAVTQIVNTLQNAPDINYIYASYKHWLPSNEQQNELLESKDLDFSHTTSFGERRFINELLELIPIESGCFTPIYCSIMRRKDACNAFELGINDKLYSSVETTFPHAVYIAENFLSQSAWYIETPCTLASLDMSWSEFAALIFAKYIPDLYEIIKKNGGKKDDIKLHRQKIMSFLPNLVTEHRKSNASIMQKLYITFNYYSNYPVLWVFWEDIKYYGSILRKQGGKIKRFAKSLFQYNRKKII
jgi:glycosyltransferase involved in cell wall biosynthesis